MCGLFSIVRAVVLIRRRDESMRCVVAALAVALAAGLAGCRTAAPAFDRTELESARSDLMRPLPGDPAALYRLRVPATGGLRLAILTSGSTGRLTISESLGSAISVTAWTGSGGGYFYDMGEGCRIESTDLSRVLGVSALPLPEAVLLLAGRLPATEDDTVVVTDESRLFARGDRWAAEIIVSADPWRVTAVREITRGSSGWKIVLGNHTGSVPGKVRLTTSKRRWAELELIRLEWHQDVELPVLPELPWCAVDDRP
jgi:hypothetical protein